MWFEGEYLNIINNLKKYYVPSWSVESLIMDAIEILKSFDEFYISHIVREGNGLADVFSNLGFSSARVWDVDDPSPLRLFLF